MDTQQPIILPANTPNFAAYRALHFSNTKMTKDEIIKNRSRLIMDNLGYEKLEEYECIAQAVEKMEANQGQDLINVRVKSLKGRDKDGKFYGEIGIFAIMDPKAEFPKEKKPFEVDFIYGDVCSIGKKVQRIDFRFLPNDYIDVSLKVSTGEVSLSKNGNENYGVICQHDELKLQGKVDYYFTTTVYSKGSAICLVNP